MVLNVVEQQRKAVKSDFRYDLSDVPAIYVDAYSGYKANERPRQLVLDEEIYEIAAILDQWYEHTATYFKVRTIDEQNLHPPYDQEVDEWTIQGGFDGDELMSRPSIELVPVDADVIRRAEKLIDGCEHYHDEDADIPFDWILDKVTGRRGDDGLYFDGTGAVPNL
jgi:hypothetical protein